MQKQKTKDGEIVREILRKFYNHVCVQIKELEAISLVSSDSIKERVLD